MSQLKKYHPSGNLKFNNLGIFQSLKYRILLEKILQMSLNLNFTPNTLGCCKLTKKKVNATAKRIINLKTAVPLLESSLFFHVALFR